MRPEVIYDTDALVPAPPGVMAVFCWRNDDGTIASVQKASEYIDEGTDTTSRLARANTIIKAVGGRPEKDPDVARIISKYMLGQVVEHKTPNQEVAHERCAKLLKELPCLKREEINAQLVDTHTDFPLWSERYDREMACCRSMPIPSAVANIFCCRRFSTFFGAAIKISKWEH